MYDYVEARLVPRRDRLFTNTLSLQVLGEILMLAGLFVFSEKKVEKLINISYTAANDC